MDDGWDLHAMFRSSAASTSVPDAAAASTSFTAAVPVNTPTVMDLRQEGFYRSMAIRDEREMANLGETQLSNIYKSGGLEEVYMEGCINQSSVPSTITGTSISFIGRRSTHDQQPSIFGDPTSFSIKLPVNSQPIQATYRKKKRVVELIREEELSKDGWAWRKYGQKPIKGTPHPRCSTTKDCLARKQVERSPTDTFKFIVSYSGDHSHPRPAHSPHQLSCLHRQK